MTWTWRIRRYWNLELADNCFSIPGILNAIKGIKQKKLQFIKGIKQKKLDFIKGIFQKKKDLLNSIKSSFNKGNNDDSYGAPQQEYGAPQQEYGAPDNNDDGKENEIKI